MATDAPNRRIDRTALGGQPAASARWWMTMLTRRVGEHFGGVSGWPGRLAAETAPSRH
jgi:hypothetical protein